jgi:hypothetical protein
MKDSLDVDASNGYGRDIYCLNGDGFEDRLCAGCADYEFRVCWFELSS